MRTNHKCNFKSHISNKRLVKKKLYHKLQIIIVTSKIFKDDTYLVAAGKSKIKLILNKVCVNSLLIKGWDELEAILVDGAFISSGSL